MPSQSLEQEALDRVARMYSSFDRRARVPMNTHSAPTHETNRKTESVPHPEPEAHAELPHPASDNSSEEKSSGLLDVLMKDKEQSLILLLLVILMKDGADMNTVLALMYILL